MGARLRRSGLLLRSAIGAGAFATLCLLLEVTVLPLSRLAGGGQAPPDLRAQRILHAFARLYLRLLVAIGWLRLDVRGAWRLSRDGPHLIVANHPSLLDVVLLCSLMPQADCIVSSVWTDHLLLRGLQRAAGHVRNDDPLALVRECVTRLRHGRSLIVFPEGTRSPAGGLGPFRRGAARIALEVGCEPLPVVISWDPPVLYKGWRWGHLRDRPIHATVRVMEPIPLKAARESGAGIAAASRQAMAELRAWFLEALDLDECGD